MHPREIEVDVEAYLRNLANVRKVELSVVKGLRGRYQCDAVVHVLSESRDNRNRVGYTVDILQEKYPFVSFDVKLATFN